MFKLHTPAIDYKKVALPRGRRLKLQVNRQGEVVVSVPPHTPQLIINRFINENLDWITREQTKRAQAPVLPANQLLLFGKSYQLQVRYQPGQRSGCLVTDAAVFINPLSPDAKLADPQVQKQLERFLKTTASHYILQRVPQWAEQMGITFTKIQLRQQRSRWGSCSSTGTLNFNWRLVHAPPAVIDYVIIHELAHRREMNHSARFWQIVKSYDPAHLAHRGWLKRQGRWVFPEAGEAD